MFIYLAWKCIEAGSVTLDDDISLLSFLMDIWGVDLIPLQMDFGVIIWNPQVQEMALFSGVLLIIAEEI